MPLRHRSLALSLAGLATASALLLAGCSADAGPSDTPATPVAGGTLTYATGFGEPTCLDPHVGGNMPQALVGTNVLESLFSQDETGAIVPWLAESGVAADDGLSWDVTLRDGIAFTDGTPMDAEAVKANVEHMKDPETASSTAILALGKVSSVDVVSPTVARFVLSEPDSALLESLAQTWLAMESPAGLERGMEANCEAPIGTGPFVFSEWVKQDHVTLTRNDDWTSAPAGATHEGPAYLDTIEWRFIPDPATRFAALQSGEVDAIDEMQPDNVVAATADGSGLDVLTGALPGASIRLELNSGYAPFDDELVRKAFIAAADVNPGIQSLFFGTVERSYSVLSSSTPFGASFEDDYAIDADKANQLLDEAGWMSRDSEGYRTKDGERLTVDFPVSTNQSIPAEVSLFEQIQATTKAVGFDVELHPMDLSSWYAALGSWDFDLTSAIYTKNSPDVLRILYDSENIIPAPSGYHPNNAHVSIPELDDAVTAAGQTTDPDERAALYEKAQELLADGAYVLPLYDHLQKIGYGDRVQGLSLLPTLQIPYFGDTWVSE
ncbi:ABC transporter substrate-binding protein [Herbiconiux flava]|uniref:Peptide/nickel transport system substrate-binding protein n=1 Tax=Herbiconiux flava TaxID=881268 RepID=A0A852SQV6_9MICO|nr:ABC transporter substrate-binding protein [Herbiconiux flava]NYD71172.1 peptide/nickel transport system substrate-binding protein [Herbiconiux flava]GLK18864.1 peptide ABC transporter [Herbiconiux flava]